MVKKKSVKKVARTVKRTAKINKNNSASDLKVEPRTVKKMSFQSENQRGGRVLGALIFAIALVIVFNQQGIILDQVSWWLQALLVLGFVFMFS